VTHLVPPDIAADVHQGFQAAARRCVRPQTGGNLCGKCAAGTAVEDLHLRDAA